MTECGICLDVIKNNCTLFCKHKFCKKCINNWFSHNNLKNCPICRYTNTSVLTRSSTHNYRRQQITTEIKQRYKNVRNSNSPDSSIAEINIIMQILQNNKWFWQNNHKFKTTLINKLLEFNKHSNKMLRDKAKLWYYSLFNVNLQTS